MDSISVIIYAVVSLLSVVTYFIYSRKSGKCLPPSPPSIPILGHISYLKKPLHRTFLSLSQKYGPIFHLRVGTRRIVVISSGTLVQECFGPKNDIALANRPGFLNATYVAYNNTTLGTASYGPHWKSIRKIANSELLSVKHLRTFYPIRSDEVRRVVAKLARETNAGFVKVDMQKTISDIIMNNAMRMIAGKRYCDDEVDDPIKIEDSRRFREIMEDVFDTSGAANLADYFPVLKWISSKYVSIVKDLGIKVDEFIQNLLDETKGLKEKQDTMLYHLRSLQLQDPELYTDTTIKGLIQSVILAGTDTSIGMMTWAMANLLNNPHVMDKARKEIDDYVGTDRLIDESDLPNLPYLNNVVSETFRLSTPTPLLVPHYSSEDTTIGGYHVPRNTIVLINGWAIQRDPTVWSEPEEFRPERFEDRDKIDSYSYIPFGIGRRTCPGSNLALKIVPFTLGAFIQCFDWKTVGDVPVDMTERLGLTMQKVEPLVAMCRARPVAHKAV